MKVYETNSGLGYMQKAYLIKAENGYLVVDLVGVEHYFDCHYIVGEFIENDDTIFAEESSYDIENSPLKGKYLFEFYLKHLNSVVN